MKAIFFVVGFLFVVIVYCCLFFVVQDLEGFFFFLEYTVHLLDLANVCIGVLASMLSDSMLNRIRLLVRYKVVFNRIYKIYLGFIGILLEQCYLSLRKKQKLVLKKGEQQILIPCML